LNEAEWKFGVASLSLPSALESVDTGNLADSQAAVSNRLAMALVMPVSFRQKPSLDGESHIPTSGGYAQTCTWQMYTKREP
jgi:hypothetical protein